MKLNRRIPTVDVEATDEDLEGMEIVSVPHKERHIVPKEAYPQSIRESALKLYLNHVKFPEIASTVGVAEGTLKSWCARDGWRDLRRAHDDAKVADIVETKKVQLNEVASLILSGVLSAIRRDMNAEGGFKAKDVPVYLNALTSVEKLARLSLGQATSISEERNKRVNVTLPFEMPGVNQLKLNDPFTQQPETKSGDPLNDDSQQASDDAGAAGSSDSESNTQ